MGAPRRVERHSWPAVAVALVVAVTVLLTVLGRTGALTVPALPGLPGPDPRVAWLLPVLRLLADLGAVGTVGCLLAAVALVPGGRDLSAQGYRWVRGAGWSAGLWGAAAALTVPVQLADLLGVGLGALTPRGLGSFAWSVPQGRAQLMVAVIAVAVLVGARSVITSGGAAVLLVLALVAALPPVVTGHAAGAGSHQAAVTGLALHVVGVLLWSGGLLALVLTRRLPAAELAVAAGRFSRAAPWLVAAVGGSGVLTAATRLVSVDQLTGSTYGRLVLAKVAALAVLIAVGAWHRRRTLPALAAGRRGAFARLCAVEVCVFAATIGLAVGLSRTAPPPGRESESLAQDLLGYPMPGPFSMDSLLTPYPDPFFPVLAAVAVGLYLLGLRRLHRRGVVWPRGRTVAWLAGWAMVLVVTSSGLATYGPVLNSVHMVQHMTLSMAAPVLLVLGGPLTLALRALRPAAAKGTRGPREWLQVLLHSRVVRLVAHPLVALAVYLVSLYGLYYTDLYELTLRSHVAHVVSFLHFLVAGSLFFWVIIGIDPAPRRLPYPARVLVLFVWLAFHTVFSLALMQSQSPLAADWFAQLERPWGPSALTDQRTTGQIAWGFGDIPIVGIIAALVVQWIRADEREARRHDRVVARAQAAGRPQDDPLTAYNDHLRRLAEIDAARSPSRRPS